MEPTNTTFLDSVQLFQNEDFLAMLAAVAVAVWGFVQTTGAWLKVADWLKERRLNIILNAIIAAVENTYQDWVRNAKANAANSKLTTNERANAMKQTLDTAKEIAAGQGVLANAEFSDKGLAALAEERIREVKAQKSGRAMLLAVVLLLAGSLALAGCVAASPMTLSRGAMYAIGASGEVYQIAPNETIDKFPGIAFGNDNIKSVIDRKVQTQAGEGYTINKSTESSLEAGQSGVLNGLIAAVAELGTIHIQQQAEIEKLRIQNPAPTGAFSGIPPEIQSLAALWNSLHPKNTTTLEPQPATAP